MKNKVVVIEAGLGAMTLGFKCAGIHVVAAYEQDKKLAELHEKNTNVKVTPCGFWELNEQLLPFMDILAGDLSNITPNKEYMCTRQSYVRKVWEEIGKVLQNSRPKMFCFKFHRSHIKEEAFSQFMKCMDEWGYLCQYNVFDIQKQTGLPVLEKQCYIIGSLKSIKSKFCFPYGEKDYIHPIEQFYDKKEKEPWYYRINESKILDTSGQNSFLCWNTDCYVEKNAVDWNYYKVPLLRVDGIIRKITHREVALLKGFPADCDFNPSNKAWMYKNLMYSPNVQVVMQLAEEMKHSLVEETTRNFRVEKGILFENLFREYLKRKELPLKEQSHVHRMFDFVSDDIYFELKLYSNRNIPFSLLRRVCESLAVLRGTPNEKIVLVVGNVIDKEVKEKIYDKYKVIVWDIANLLWLFDEFSDIKNELVALLEYSVEGIEAQIPQHNLFNEHLSKNDENEWELKLRRVEPGKEHFKQYEETCTEILKYVLGDYLSLWIPQQESNDGLYCFDLCCKIKHGVDQEFFDVIQRFFNSKYIVFEFKNYSKEITQKEIYTTEKYLYEKALRGVAIIVSRYGADAHALSAARGCLRENGKLILCLSDDDLLKLVDIKDKGEQSTALFFEDMLDNMLIHLEK